MPFRKHPTYVRKARNGYQLQRGVHKDFQPVIGKTVWVEGAGSTYRVAQRLSPSFAAKTDRLIAETHIEVSLTGDELSIAIGGICFLRGDALRCAEIFVISKIR